ncbi:MAG TPA: M48 family metallopeptidase, partial [Urbifossiella sp.]|nr:M48 family metallopeptidase [Urbifossiella sp.]
FMAVYLALTLGSAVLCYYCFDQLGRDPSGPRRSVTYHDASGRLRTRDQARSDSSPGFVLFLGGVFSGLLCLFMVKGLFKSGSRNTSIKVEVTEAEQPELFAFIRKVCRDTRAPVPHRVYLYPEVTAAVAFDETLLNLILPSRKNLIIGLGLVNRLNLAEFKAVLAHEFGHFSQNSMRLGSYVYTANRIVGDVVYARDWLDDMVSAATRIDLRISVFVWVFQGGLWVVRKGLHFLFRAINFANVSMSRQMEYNADLVAVSVTGSDPLVFALARLDFASETLGQAWGDLMAAADHGRYSRDVYYHQTKAADYLKVKRGDPTLGEVPELPADPTQTVQVFKPEDTRVPAMWATHPANPEREANAKARYFRGPSDERPAWVLFRDEAAVRESMSWAAYKHNRKEKLPEVLEPAEDVQAFIDAEHAETTHPPQYHGLYENRYVKPGELAELVQRDTWREFDDAERLAEAHANLSGETLRDRMDAHRKRQEEANRLTGLSRGFVALAGKDFEHRGNRYGLADARRLLTQVEEEINQDFAWMHLHDRSAFGVHYAMARQLGAARADELEARYRFHFGVQAIHQALVAWSNHVQQTLAALQGARQVPQEQFQEALGVLRECRNALNEQLGAADDLKVPALTNMTAGSPLGPYLFGGALIPNLPASATSLDGKWINDLLTQVGEVIEKSARVLFKSLGAILILQDRVAAEWHATRAAGETAPAEAG